MASALFSPLSIGPVLLKNRIAIAPMAQYSANDGCASDWHLQHLMTLAMSGAGLVMVESSAVERRGRAALTDLGIYSDANEAALARVIAAARRAAPEGTRFGIQLGHTGRKGSAHQPWDGGGPLAPVDDGWSLIAPSAIPFDNGWPTPQAADEPEIERLLDTYRLAAQRAARVGFDVVEIHMAHGYLVHSFQSPVTNHRSDKWGGNAERRLNFPIEVARAVHSVLPESIAVGARITGSDWLDDGIRPADAVALARALKAVGVAYVCVSSGGIVPRAPIQIGLGYQVPFAEQVRKEAKITVRAVGLIVDPHQADAVVASGKADQVAIARAIIDDPRWVWRAAELLEADLQIPAQYRRATGKLWPGKSLLREAGGSRVS
jgi:2,4-dienoyl-CoA reductase-like NADH-dependent reductase (Old Yellow Enzyme family)